MYIGFSAMLVGSGNPQAVQLGEKWNNDPTVDWRTRPVRSVHSLRTKGNDEEAVADFS